MAELQTANTNTVVGYFESHNEAEAAIAALRDAGFQASEVGVAAHAGATSAGKAAENVKQHGAGFWDKVRDFFDGNVAEPYADEKTRGDFADHEITAPSTSTASYGGARWGSENYGSEDLHSSLSGLSVSPAHSRYFGDKLRRGGALVTVSAGSRREEAIEILEDNGADVGDDIENYTSEYAEPASAGTSKLADAERNLQLYGEVLRVQKDRVSAGEVRLRKEVVTETQTVQVPITREELVLERVAADGKPAPDASFGGESEIRIPLTEERARVEKQAVVNEEVRVGKREVSNVESFNEQVRHEELKVEDESRTKAS